MIVGSILDRMFSMVNWLFEAYQNLNKWLISRWMVISRKYDFDEHATYCGLEGLHTPIDCNRAYHEQRYRGALSLLFSCSSNHLIHNYLHNRRAKAPNYFHEKKYFSSWKKIIIFMKRNISLHEDNSVMMFYWD